MVFHPLINVTRTPLDWASAQTNTVLDWVASVTRTHLDLESGPATIMHLVRRVLGSRVDLISRFFNLARWEIDLVKSREIARSRQIESRPKISVLGNCNTIG